MPAHLPYIPSLRLESSPEKLIPHDDIWIPKEDVTASEILDDRTAAARSQAAFSFNRLPFIP